VVQSVVNRCIGMVRWFGPSVGPIVNTFRCSINILFIYIYNDSHRSYTAILNQGRRRQDGDKSRPASPRHLAKARLKDGSNPSRHITAACRGLASWTG
jgi:hypothetical protein